MTDTIQIPEFLVRANWTPEQVASNEAAWDSILKNQTPAVAIEPKASGKRRRTAVYRAELAGVILASVADGADTFGKIRKRVGDRYDDAELRIGIRAAKRWTRRAKRTGTRAKPSLSHFYARIESQGRRYIYVRKGA